MCFIGAVLLGLAVEQNCNQARAAQLLRGPYLQSPTPESIRIRWRTDVATPSYVAFGFQPYDFAFDASDTNSTTEHEVQLTGLLPGTVYFYSVGSPTQPLAQGTNCYFTTAPMRGVASPTRVWVIGDSGGFSFDYGNPAAVRDAYYQFAGTRYTDVWLALGDNAYNDGLDEEYQQEFFELFPLLLRQAAPWSTIGNHDAYATMQLEPVPYLNIFSFPTNGEAGGVASGTERYYSFDQANIHFVCLDAMTQSRATNGPMANWLRSDLSQNTNLWTIAFWHHPPYSKGSHDSDREIELIEMRQNIVPILEQHGVDLVLSGHSHIYERSYLLHGHYGRSTNLQPAMILDRNSGREDETGPYVKATSGTNAHRGCVYAVVGSSASTEPVTGFHPAMFLQLQRTGSLVLDIAGNRLEARFLGSNGAIDDHFSIVKEEPESLRICQLMTQNGKLVVRCRSVPGQLYQLQRATDLSAPDDWKAVGPPVTALGTTTSWTNNPPLDGQMVCYRVKRINP